MRFGSVCSGIEAASVAWSGLGWSPAWFSEIEKAPSKLLQHHYPTVTNVGDMREIVDRIDFDGLEAPDLLCGGTPCQAFSVAGLRNSLSDERGNLSLVFCEIANAIDRNRPEPCVVFWENVPGVLSTKDNAFGCFLAGLAGEERELVAPGGRWADAGYVFGPQRSVAWRVLDAQHFGLAQRRKRVFVVASARADFDPAAVLFEREGVRRDFAPSRSAGESSSCGTASCPSWNSGISHTLKADGFDASEDGAGRGTPLVLAFDTTQMTSALNYSRPKYGDPCHPLAAGANPPAIAVALRGREGGGAAELGDDLQNCLRASSGGGDKPHVLTGAKVRRLTPRECERLQGFPDDYTEPMGKDGPRYRALGNSWAVPVVRWIGQRIEDQLL